MAIRKVLHKTKALFQLAKLMESYNRPQLKIIDHLQMYIRNFIVYGLSNSHEQGIPKFKDF